MASCCYRGLFGFHKFEQLSCDRIQQFCFCFLLPFCTANGRNQQSQPDCGLIGLRRCGAGQAHQINNSHPAQWSVCSAKAWPKGWRYSTYGLKWSEFTIRHRAETNNGGRIGLEPATVLLYRTHQSNSHFAEYAVWSCLGPGALERTGDEGMQVVHDLCIDGWSGLVLGDSIEELKRVL